MFQFWLEHLNSTEGQSAQQSHQQQTTLNLPTSKGSMMVILDCAQDLREADGQLSITFLSHTLFRPPPFSSLSSSLTN